MANGMAAITATVTAWKAMTVNALASATPALTCDTRGQVLRARVGPTPTTTSVALAKVRPTVRMGWGARLIKLYLCRDARRRLMPAATGCRRGGRPRRARV